MVKATEKELLRLITQINELRIFAKKPPFLLGKMTLNRKMQRRFAYQLKYIDLDREIMVEYTPFLPGQVLHKFLTGILEGIQIGTKIAAIKDILSRR